MKGDGQSESMDELRRRFDGLLELVSRHEQRDLALRERERAVGEIEVSLRSRLEGLVPREADLARREAELAAREARQAERESGKLVGEISKARGDHRGGEGMPVSELRAKTEAEEKKVHEAKEEDEVLRDFVTRFREELAAGMATSLVSPGGGEPRGEGVVSGEVAVPWLSLELLEFLSNTEPSPEETLKAVQWVVTIGSGPYPEEQFDAYLRACGIEPYEGGQSWIIVGRDGWTVEGIEQATANAERIYSQELFALAMITGRDPYTWPSRVLFPLASGHPALEYLGVTEGIWPELIELDDEATDSAGEPDGESEREDEREDSPETEMEGGEGGGDDGQQRWDRDWENSSDRGQVERLGVPEYLGNGFGMVDQSPLNAMGYLVGARRGLNLMKRREVLSRAFRGVIPHTGPAEYMVEWGAPGSVKRLWRIAHHLASLIRLQRNKPVMVVAVTDWSEDLAWLKQQFYSRTFYESFYWPEV